MDASFQSESSHGASSIISRVIYLSLNYLKFFMVNTSNNLSQSFTSLLQVMKEDEEINSRITQMLKLKPFQRRLLLNKWLEQLRHKHAPEKLIQSLSCLFDDSIADKVLAIVNNHKIKNSENDLFLNNTKF